MSKGSAPSSAAKEEHDAVEFLEQTRIRSGELIAALQRERANLEAHVGTDAADKAEGLAALDEMIDAARRVMNDAERSLRARTAR